MKTKEIREQLAAGVTVFARRPRHGAREIEIITVESVARGYVTGSSTASRRTRWPVAVICPLAEVEGQIKIWAAERRLKRRTRRECIDLQDRVLDLLAKAELPDEATDTMCGPGGDQFASMSLTLYDLRKLVAVLDAFVNSENREC